MKALIYYLLALTLAIISFNKNINAQETLVPGKTINQKLLKDQKFEYTITLNNGDYFEMNVEQKGVDLYVTVFDPSNNALKSFDSPNGQNGPEPVSIVSTKDGIYKFAISTLTEGMSESEKAAWQEMNQGDYEINSIKILSAVEYSKKLEEEKIKQQNWILILKNFAYPLNGVTAGIGYEDLEFLEPALKDVQIVGLGEATHGTREFFEMKARMLEFLVKEMGFTVFAIEASYAACNNINEYVLDGKGDVYTALASQGFWTWDTEEVIDMIELMRKYNESVTEEKKVKFEGFDIQFNSKGYDVVQDYLKRVDSNYAVKNNNLFDLMEQIEKRDTSGKNINIDSCKNEFQSLLEFMKSNKGNYIEKSSEAEYDYALQHSITITQYFDVYFMNTSNMNESSALRDRYMASNFEYLVRKEKPGTKFVVWAHNAHILKRDDMFKPFGYYLTKTFGDSYYAFGFSFSKGSYQAMEMTADNKRIGLQEFTVDAAKENSLDWYFAQTGFSKFMINFRDISLQHSLQEFFESELQTRSVGAISNRDYLETYYAPITIKTDFDGMIFIDNTTRSRPTQTGMRK